MQISKRSRNRFYVYKWSHTVWSIWFPACSPCRLGAFLWPASTPLNHLYSGCSATQCVDWGAFLNQALLVVLSAFLIF